MRRKAYAKITLSLYAYRDGDTLKFKNVIVPIDLFDVVYLEKNETMEISTNQSFLPNDKRNTVYLALDILKNKYNIQDNFKVKIVKNIPAQSGLGGGSSNAAAIIHMFDDLYNLNMSLEDKLEVAQQIDEDTPFCVLSHPATVKGIGEIIESIEFEHDLYYLMIKPGYGISTKSFLKKYDDADLNYEASMDKMREACITGDYRALIDSRYNSFENLVIKQYGALEKVITRLEAMGLEGVGMTGSGTCVYGLSQSKEEVVKIFEELVFDYPFVKYGRILK